MLACSTSHDELAAISATASRADWPQGLCLVGGRISLAAPASPRRAAGRVDQSIGLLFEPFERDPLRGDAGFISASSALARSRGRWLV